MAARQPFWKWQRWKSIGFCLWPPSTCIWNLKLKFQSKLDLCSGNHVVYRQTDGRTDGRTDKVNPVYPPSNFVGRGYNKTTHFWWWFTKCEYMCPIYWIYMSRVFIWGKRSQNSKKNQLSKNQGPVSIKKVFPYIEGRSSLYNGNSYIVISRLGLSPAAFELRLMGWESPNISRSHARYGVYFENFVENSFDSLWFRNATHWDIELSQHWQHQAITWTNVDLSSKLFSGIHLRAISPEVLMYLICNMCSDITLLKLHVPSSL